MATGATLGAGGCALAPGLREPCLMSPHAEGSAAAVGGFGGWQTWAGSGARGGWFVALRSDGARVGAAVGQTSDGATETAFGALVIGPVRAFLVRLQRKDKLARGKSFIH